MSLTIHGKYKYFHVTVQTAEDGRQKFHFRRLPSDVTSCLIYLLTDTPAILFIIDMCLEDKHSKMFIVH